MALLQVVPAITQNKGHQKDFSICGKLKRYVAQTRKDIEKRFSASIKVENEAIPVKKICSKNFKFYPLPNSSFFAKFSSKCFINFIDFWPMCFQWYTATFCIFHNGICITLKLPSIRIFF